MRRMATREVRRNLGTLIDRIRKEPVTIERDGEPVAVVLSLADYERLERHEEERWPHGAAVPAACISPEESAFILRRLGRIAS